MKCQDMLKLLGDYVDGQIDPTLCQEFEQHMSGCDACRVVVDTLHKTVTLYKDDQVFELPADFQARLHRALKDKWRQRATKPADSDPPK